jgi:hypothetical protein
MSREDEETRLREAGWIERRGHWQAPWMTPDEWLNFELATAFLRAAEMTDSTRDLAKAALEHQDRRNAELAAMNPEDRERAIEAWARKLAEDTCTADD